MKAKIIRVLVLLLLATSAMVGTPRTAEAAVDIYTTPGYHHVNGRDWYTACAPYSSTITRCETQIKSSQVTFTNGRFVTTTGWFLNNRTYVAAPRVQWAGNPLATPGLHTINGRDWKTECDTPVTGRNGCRSYIWASYIAARKTSSGYSYYWTQGWRINNIVRFSTGEYLTVSGTGDSVVDLPSGVTKGMITATYSGAGNFIIETLDVGNHFVDLPVNEIGSYSGTTLFGMYDFQEPARRLQVTADTEWRITITPESLAPRISTSITGATDSVFLYDGPARSMSATYSGSQYFMVGQYPVFDGYGDTLVSRSGAYNGTFAISAGPSVFEVLADAPWTATLR